MTVQPILATLRRHKTAAGLIALEIALSCAIVSNAVFLIGSRLERMQQPSGIAESEVVQIQIGGFGLVADPAATARDDLAALKALPGVQSASTVNQVPFGRSSWYSGLRLDPEQLNATLVITTYLGSEDLLETLGVKLVGGRDFRPDEYVEFEALVADPETIVPAVILTRAVAERIFPDESALGKQVYAWGDEPQTVVGVIEQLAKPNDLNGPATAGHSVIVPVSAPVLHGSTYLLRTAPGERQAALEAGIATLQDLDPDRIVVEDQTRTLEAFRDEFFHDDRAMAWLLVGVCIALMVVTALGIVGLASFWVQQRSRQIGIRRALGATRGQIVRYFQTENFLIASAGILLGMVLAYAINGALMSRYEIARLPWHYLPIGALALWALGQFAVLGPALRAARVPPAVATRSV